MPEKITQITIMAIYILAGVNILALTYNESL